jgi:hypothetical protein
MSMQVKFGILTLLAIVIATIAVSVGPVGRSSLRRRFGVDAVTGYLFVVMAALLVVGVVSHTMLRHVVQVIPLITALLLRQSRAGTSAAAPLFGFWLLTMGAIWLFLLGVARIVSGRFTTTEIALTIVIGAGSLFGLIAASRRGPEDGLTARLITIAGFGVLQLAAMIASFQPFIARR